jgi:hypothetical protein
MAFRLTLCSLEDNLVEESLRYLICHRNRYEPRSWMLAPIFFHSGQFSTRWLGDFRFALPAKIRASSPRSTGRMSL